MSAVLRSNIAIEYRPPEDLGCGHAIAFGDALAGALHIPIRQFGTEPRVEVLASDDLLFGALSAEESARESAEETQTLEEVSRETYARLIQHVRDAGYPYFVRMWNFVGSINEVDAGERYQLFCAGRHDAFIAAGYHHDVDLPSASAVGMPGRGLIAYFLAARDAGVQVENPRQVAAYNYPPEYGTKSPSFSRATVWRDTVFVSGTSSVVGHATVHIGDVSAQLDETVQNIEAVLARTGRTLANVVAAKTYLRNAADYELVSRRLAGVFTVNLFLEADICRKELLLEIECVAR
jgi:chorismate lyase/3-hydroxybenzoate synthase